MQEDGGAVGFQAEGPGEGGWLGHGGLVGLWLGFLCLIVLSSCTWSAAGVAVGGCCWRGGWIVGGVSWVAWGTRWVTREGTKKRADM